MIEASLDHLAFRVSDVNKIADLLKQLGYVEVRRTEHHGGAVELESPKQPGLVLEFSLLREAKGEAPGFDHASFFLDGEAQLKELEAAGFPVEAKTSLVPGSGRLKTDWRDPDNIKWQFTMN
jgi:glyoxylase I family protein